MNVLVLYQSRSGNTRATAEFITSAVRAQGHDVTIKSVIEVRQADAEGADLLFIGTWIQGFILFGVKPAGADLWVRALPPLDGKPVAIFCTYAFSPRSSLDKLAGMLSARGAHAIAQQAFHRRRLTEGVDAFVLKVLQAVDQS